MEQAVALALERNRDVIAARLDIRAAELDRVAAGLYPNPILSYSIGNLTVGAGNPFNTQNGAPANPPFFSQTVQTVGVSEFIASGDNPNTFGLSLSLPLPLFDRNQANVGRAELDIRRASNDAERIEIVVRQEVADAARRVERAKTLLGVFEGGMLERADNALRVAEKSYKTGAISLLELLEAQRTYLETRAQYLRAQYDYRQSRVDLRSAIGSDNL
jgi:outer membrane protein TolC